MFRREQLWWLDMKNCYRPGTVMPANHEAEKSLQLSSNKGEAATCPGDLIMEPLLNEIYFR